MSRNTKIFVTLLAFYLLGYEGGRLFPRELIWHLGWQDLYCVAVGAGASVMTSKVEQWR